MRLFAVTFGVLLAMEFMVIMGLIGGQPSLRDIGSPCRRHGGVAQYVPRHLEPWVHESALVVCRDGKIGRIK